MLDEGKMEGGGGKMEAGGGKMEGGGGGWTGPSEAEAMMQITPAGRPH